jgi:Ni,Fe-hydrogenase III small subunit
MVFKRLREILPWRKSLYTEDTTHKAPKSIFIRHVDAGSSNAIEQEIIALFNPVYDVERFGFHLVASPRHADILLITGPCTRSMEAATLAAFHAMPEPRCVVTVGDGFEEDSVFYDSYAVMPLPDEIAAVRVAHIPGDPPSPQQILDVLLDLPTYPK